MRADDDAELAAFAGRVLLEAWQEATATYWRRRASILEAARPRPGDYTGQATRADIAARHQALTDAAQACRNRAAWAEGSRGTFDDTLTDLARPGAAA